MLRHTYWRKENLQEISGQEIYRNYQDRKSTGTIRTGNLHVISEQEIYRKYQDRKSTGKYQDRKSTGSLRTVNLHDRKSRAISGQKIYRQY